MLWCPWPRNATLCACDQWSGCFEIIRILFPVLAVNSVCKRSMRVWGVVQVHEHTMHVLVGVLLGVQFLNQWLMGMWLDVQDLHVWL